MPFGPARVSQSLSPEALSPQAQIAAIYTAILGRAPDPAGLAFWVGEYQAARAQGRDREAVWGAIATSIAKGDPGGEAARAHPVLASADGRDADAFVTALFDNLYNRTPTDAERTFWGEELGARWAAPGAVIVDLIVDSVDGSQGADATVLRNKVAAGRAYADAFANADADWARPDDAPGATQVAALVGADPESVTAAAVASETLAGRTEGRAVTGAVSVDGAAMDELAANVGALVVGDAGAGTVSLTDGAELTAAAAGTGPAVRVLADNGDASHAVAIDGGRIAVTRDGTAEAAAPNLRLASGSSGIIAENGGTLAVTGPGARAVLESGTSLTLRGGGELVLSNPAAAARSAVVLRSGAQDSRAAVEITGTDSGITFAGSGPSLLLIGDSVRDAGQDAPNLRIASGAAVTGATNLVLGNRAETEGELTVTGDSALDLTGTDAEGFGAFAEIGRRGEGRLEVADGSTVTIDGAGGDQPGLALATTAIGGAPATGR